MDNGRYAHLSTIEGLNGLAAASQELKPVMTELQCAVMVCDVKGFTQLTEILSKRGRLGMLRDENYGKYVPSVRT